MTNTYEERRAQEALDRIEFNKTQELIAQALGEGWTYRNQEDTYRPYGHLTNGTFTLNVQFSYSPKSAYVYGWTRPHAFNAVTVYEDSKVLSVTGINVSPAKSPAQIASDIKRRLLPVIESVQGRYQERLNGSIQYWNGKENYKEQISNLFAGVTTESHRDILQWGNRSINAAGFPDEVTGNLYIPGLSLKLQIMQDSLNIDGHVSKELGLKILALIRHEIQIVKK